ncbi:hypothetical protein PVAG01_08573 [Phlyctema vagabunda]|uniref:Uncharacterized protein n=1 Tax=Phlyctema vagabunda TaxID=108571 RepID=A0ABR4P9W1_9HELO
MVSALVIVSAVVALIAVALGGAYVSGALDPIIEQIGFYLLKAKGEAEAKKLQAQGLKEGQDFVKGDLPGNQQANDAVKGGLDDVKGGLGGGLKI